MPGDTDAVPAGRYAMHLGDGRDADRLPGDPNQVSGANDGLPGGTDALPDAHHRMPCGADPLPTANHGLPGGPDQVSG